MRRVHVHVKNTAWNTSEAMEIFTTQARPLIVREPRGPER